MGVLARLSHLHLHSEVDTRWVGLAGISDNPVVVWNGKESVCVRVVWCVHSVVETDRVFLRE
jgi:hypothetical protein